MLQLIEHLPAPWREAVLGALVGDALGVPHEFKPAHLIPKANAIQMCMPGSYVKSHAAVPYGVWSDDGSQLMALLDCLAAGGGHFDPMRFVGNLLSWFDEGKFQAGGRVFDCGLQTHASLHGWRSGRGPDMGPNPNYCGNGALMRVLPAATLPDVFAVTQEEALQVAMAQAAVTHPQPIGVLCCALYVEMCWLIQHTGVRPSLLDEAWVRLEARHVLPLAVSQSWPRLRAASLELPSGSGYVASTLCSALWALQKGSHYSEVVRNAISLGDDTDTLACIAGGLAGLAYGLDGQGREWVSLLRV